MVFYRKNILRICNVQMKLRGIYLVQNLTNYLFLIVTRICQTQVLRLLGQGAVLLLRSQETIATVVLSICLIYALVRYSYLQLWLLACLRQYFYRSLRTYSLYIASSYRYNIRPLRLISRNLLGCRICYVYPHYNLLINLLRRSKRTKIERSRIIGPFLYYNALLQALHQYSICLYYLQILEVLKVQRVQYEAYPIYIYRIYLPLYLTSNQALFKAKSDSILSLIRKIKSLLIQSLQSSKVGLKKLKREREINSLREYRKGQRSQSRKRRIILINIIYILYICRGYPINKIPL